VNRSAFLENLECRTLFSASASSVFDAAVISDRLAVKADLDLFKSDCFSLQANMIRDLQTIKADKPSDASTFVPLVKQFRTDLNSMHAQLAADRLNESAAVLSDEAAILKIRVHVLKDHGNSTALSQDHANLLAARIKLQDDMVAGLDARIATRETDFSKISTDINNIVTAVDADTNASAAFQAAVQKWSTDRTTGMAAITADLANLQDARTQLSADLTAEQSAS
jgi:hypothetical protein